ncbi:hypothetical protein BDW42DRAFT_188278 [Aspergillus taichungensis]|uniref:Serine/arginine repetitive matrix protein 1 n=1 Tax=Aspergillus taichungensis TaxID=482145 RepID=A0A2J5HJB4_9EURO|nr:hypothetical protein BDW42DRAFT_188278 [Aspergillus taichungensis]
MDWDRNRRFDDHRGGESYRPANSRSYFRRSRSPQRNRSPRLFADTWVPSTTRTYGRVRSRSPSGFRRRSSRSPSPYNRDSGLSSYARSSPPSRRFSPRRDGRPRSPRQTSWRPRSPYNEGRSRNTSWSRPPSKRPRDPSPVHQDSRFSRSERSSIPDHYARYSPSSRQPPVRENGPRAAAISRSRSPFRGVQRERHLDGSLNQRRRSPSPKRVSSVHASAPGSHSNSRLSSPSVDRGGATQLDSTDRSPAHPTHDRRFSKPPDQDRVVPAPCKRGKDETNPGPSASEQHLHTSSNDTDFGDIGVSRPNDVHERNPHLDNALSPSIPSHPRAFPSVQTQSPPSGPSHGPKHQFSHHRGLNLSLLSAPTRPRGGAGFKESNWAGGSARRGPVSAMPHGPPTGPRSINGPQGQGVEIIRQNTYRQGSNPGVLTHPRAPRYMNHLSSSCSIIPGGRVISSGLDVSIEKRLSQLDSDQDRLLEQNTDSQSLKRLGIRDWDRFDRESSICALKSELAEGHLQRLADGGCVHAGTLF